MLNATKNANPTATIVGRIEKIKIFLGLTGHKFQGIHLLTIPTMSGGKKVLELFDGKVYKLAEYVFVNIRDYNRAIELKGEKLGLDFSEWKMQPHNYATAIGGNLLCHNNDMQMDIEDINKRIYAQFMAHKGSVISTKYFDANMNEIDFEVIKQYLPEKKISAKQSDFGFTQTDFVPVINPSIDSIIRFTANGQEYISE
jgi:hypothetical protein